MGIRDTAREFFAPRREEPNMHDRLLEQVKHAADKSAEYEILRNQKPRGAEEYKAYEKIRQEFSVKLDEEKRALAHYYRVNPEFAEEVRKSREAPSAETFKQAYDAGYFRERTSIHKAIDEALVTSKEQNITWSPKPVDAQVMAPIQALERHADHPRQQEVALVQAAERSVERGNGRSR
jgi:hypothetical protein